ncbi:MAG: hypothetical protein ACKPBA_10395 [Planctomycetota bacterium]
MSTRRRPAAPFAAALLALGVLAAAGCYRHVVEVRGGPSNVPVHEANIGKDESIWSNPAPKQRPTSDSLDASGFPGRTP